MRRTIGLIAAAGFAALVTIVYVIYVGRVLGPAEYSEFSTALSLVYFFAIILSPLAPSMARVVARLSARGDHRLVPGFRRLVLRRLSIAALAALPLAGLGAVALTRALKFPSPLPLLLAFGCALAFSILSADRGTLQGLFRFHVYNASIVAEAVARLLLTLLLFRFWPSPAAALAAYLIALGVGEILIVPFLRDPGDSRPTSAADSWDELLRLAWPILVLMIAAATFQNLDMLAVKRWFDPETAGRYGAALALARAFGLVFMPLWVLVGPTLTRLHEARRPLVPTAVRFVGGYVALSAIPLVALAVAGAQILDLLFGPAFAAGGWIAPHLGLISVFVHAALLAVQVFVTLHDFRFIRWFLVGIAAEIILLVLFHSTISGVLIVLYAVQIGVGFPLVWMLAIRARVRT